MNLRTKMLAPTLALSMVAATAGAAFAENHKGNNETNDQADVQMMMQAKVTLADAIRAAETAQGGKALSASFEANKGQPGYEVEVALAGGTIESVLVDAQSGKILKKLTDDEQGENGEDQEDDSD